MTTAALTCLGSCWLAAWPAPPCCYSPVDREQQRSQARGVVVERAGGRDGVGPTCDLLLLGIYPLLLQSLSQMTLSEVLLDHLGEK